MKTIKRNGTWLKSEKFVYYEGKVYMVNIALFKVWFLLEDGRFFVESILNPERLLSQLRANDTIHESVVKHFQENGGYRPNWREES